ncbi:MAG: T9SS type A sorting domain-containing protein [Chitinophagales bacterium]|nr:T9SS type A sorting domain-containing protein [Chitinophagales bacterium]MDW8427967.1 T9SS type A sorting domain-containing protein [Chitinophagales bacterium]
MKNFTALVGAVLWLTALHAHEGVDPYEKRYPPSLRYELSRSTQKELQRSAAWQHFTHTHPKWRAHFDQITGLPHRAYGEGIAMPGPGNAVLRAQNFIENHLGAFGVQRDNLVLRSHVVSKYHYVDFYQQHKGLEVLTSRVTVRMTHDYRVVLFGIEYYPDVSVNPVPALTPSAAAAAAAEGLPQPIQNITVADVLKIFPMPSAQQQGFNYHLIYTCEVIGGESTRPYRYLTYVDAHNGEILYRTNRVRGFEAQVNLKATVSINPTVPTEVHNMPYVRIRVNGTDYYTDAQGNVTIPNITSATSATVYIQGLYSRVYEGNSTTVSSYTVTLNSGTNNLTMGSAITLRETSGYFHVTKIHDHMKSYFPTFTLLDDDLITVVDVSGSCNAFYDGNSVNFYAQSTTCNAMALLGDVVYHEYGHAINDHYYSAYGYNFQNGAMDEAYADVWAMTLTDVPEIGRGFYKSTDEGIREYQNSIKVYPHDIVGEVHADGEILAGSWWWVRYNTGSMPLMTALFTESYNGFANGLNGQEGKVFREVLLDALAADDDNGNLADGTPNDDAILHAFALHGITLIGDVTLAHVEPLALLQGQPIVISANVFADYSTYVGAVKVHYKVHGTSAFTTVTMSKITGSKYEAQLPPQPKGTLLQYYFTVEDIFGMKAFEDPPGVVDDPQDENIPYFLLVGYKLVHSEDFDNYAGAWVTGDPADKATTGKWIIDEPQATYQVPGNPATMVQTGTDHTTIGINTNVCAVTANNVSPNDPYNAQDVDNGATTLYSPVFDLSNYVNPAISYYRWYTNEASANPRSDHWKVFITNNGSTWKVVEWNDYPQRAWRNFTFIVSDYVTPTATIQLKFVAEDSVILGAYLDGGSIVEAALDDLYIWEETDEVIGTNEVDFENVRCYPNPAREVLYLQVFNENIEDLKLRDAYGQVLWQQTNIGSHMRLRIPVNHLPSGSYMLHWTTDRTFGVQKVIVQR